MNEDRVLTIIAILSLLIGISYYILFREPIIASYWFGIQDWHSGLNLYILGWLPSFVHQFAFVLLTWIALEREYEKFAIYFWLIINIFFEFGQSFESEYLDYFPNIIASYFRNGTYSFEDILAIIGATIVAYFLMSKYKKRSL